MTLVILSKFNKINDYQEGLIELCDARHKLLLENKLDDAESINRKEMLLLFDLEKAMQSLKLEVLELCNTYGVEGNELKLVLPFLTIEDRNDVMACQRCAFTYEKILKNKLKSNESLVKSKMVLLEIIRHSYVQISQEAGENGKSLLNRKY